MEATSNKTPQPLAYTVEEAAAVLGGLSKPTLYALIHQADFPVFRVGRRTLISAEGLREWVAAQIEKEAAL